jgi:1,2-dihydroxy-3-keto-5-methylthiopentene dioxygenase
VATLSIPAEHRTIHDPDAVHRYLEERGIEYERWTPPATVPSDASTDDVLSAYASKIDELKARGGYVTADVIDVKPETPNLDAMLAKFNTEHWHDEDEVRFVVEGRGLFHIHPSAAPVFAIEVEAGDLIRVPRGTHHWFDLCGERRIRAIRLFQDVSGWTPHYTGSGIDRGYQPVCFGPAYFPRPASAAGGGSPARESTPGSGPDAHSRSGGPGV